MESTQPERPKPVELTVKRLATTDAWKDIVRIKEGFRKDRNGAHIHRGTICRITAPNGRSKWIVVNGRKPNDNKIEMDLNVRLALEVKIGETYEFLLDQLSPIQSLWFPWKASDPMFRLPAQMGIISFVIGVVLGAVGILVGVVPLLREHKQAAPQAVHSTAGNPSSQPTGKP